MMERTIYHGSNPLTGGGWRTQMSLPEEVAKSWLRSEFAAYLGVDSGDVEGPYAKHCFTVVHIDTWNRTVYCVTKDKHGQWALMSADRGRLQKWVAVNEDSSLSSTFGLKAILDKIDQLGCDPMNGTPIYPSKRAPRPWND